MSLNVRHPGEQFVLRAENEWPLARTQWTKFHLDPTGMTLSREPVAKEQAVEYAALETRVGETLSIDTTFHTTRTGKLIKWTQPALTLQIGTDAAPIVLTVPKETIQSITIITPAAAEPAKDAGTSGAKKN